MIVRTTLFELCDRKYNNLSELAEAMGISVSQVYRVKEGKRNINQKFIVGAIEAFPEHKLGDLFYLAPQPATEEKQSIESTRQASGGLDSAMEEHADHLKSHASATISLIEASQELKKGAGVANKILS